MSTLVQRSVLDASGFPLDQIQILGIAARGFHGVLESEREAGQDFSADVTLYLDTRAAARDDDLDETVNYALVAQDVVDILSGEPVDLIETVAEQIAAAVLDRPLVASVDVTVHKPQAPIPVPFSDVTVTINRDRLNVPVVTSPVAPALDDLPADDLAGDPLSSTTRPDVALSAALPAAGALSADTLAAGGGAPGSALLDDPLSGTVPAPVELPEAFEPVALRVDETESDVETPEPSSSPTLDLPLGRLAAPVAARESDPASYSTSELHLESDLVHDDAVEGDVADDPAAAEHQHDALDQDALDQDALAQTALDQTALDQTERHPVGDDETGEGSGLETSTRPEDSTGSGAAVPVATGAASVPPVDDSLLEEQARLSEQARRPEVFGLRPRTEAHQRPTSEDEAPVEGDDVTGTEAVGTAEHGTAESPSDELPSDERPGDEPRTDDRSADSADDKTSAAAETATAALTAPSDAGEPGPSGAVQPAQPAAEQPARSAAASAAEPATAASSGGPQLGAAFFAAASAAVANASRDHTPLSFEELLNPSSTPEQPARAAAEQSPADQSAHGPRSTPASVTPERTERTERTEDSAAEHAAPGATTHGTTTAESPTRHETALDRPADPVSAAARQRDADPGSETTGTQPEPAGAGEEHPLASALEPVADLPVWQPSAFAFEPVRGRPAEPTRPADSVDLSRFAPPTTDETHQSVVAQESALETTALLDPNDVEDPIPAEDPTPVEEPVPAEGSSRVQPTDDTRLDETQLVPTHPAPAEVTYPARDELTHPAPTEPVQPVLDEPTSSAGSATDETQVVETWSGPSAGEPAWDLPVDGGPSDLDSGADETAAEQATDEALVPGEVTDEVLGTGRLTDGDAPRATPAAADTLDSAPLSTAAHGSTPLDTAEWAAPADRDEASEASEPAEASETDGSDEAGAGDETDGFDETEGSIETDGFVDTDGFVETEGFVETDEPAQAGGSRPVVGDPEAPTSPVPVVVPDDEDEAPASTPPSGVPPLAAPVAGGLGLGAGARGETPLQLDRMDARPDGPVEAVLALGANLGDAQGTLRRAVAELGTLTGVDVVQVGPLARTAAVGGPEQPDFLNTVVIVQTTLSPRELLHGCQSVEAGNGRVRDVRWGPRTLDIDIVVFGDVIGSATDLELPHPRANERAFVLAPWAHLDPEAHLPGLGGGPVAALAATAHDREGIRWLALDWLHDAEVPTAAQTSRPAAVAPALTAVQVVSLPDGDGPAAPADPTGAPAPSEVPGDAPVSQPAPAAESSPAAAEAGVAAPGDRDADRPTDTDRPL